MPAGRPTIMTEKLIGKLEQAFLMGCTDREACCFVDINPNTLYEYCKKNPEFTERKETLKNNLSLQAKIVILDAIQVDKDVLTANKVIDRKEGTKVKQEITGKLEFTDLTDEQLDQKLQSLINATSTDTSTED